ncbi:MAG: hypothetical protein CV087_16000 [Candidatus Brocadia sp. WS118]|nr:MAG: hypothetical protein CV087_16000 [Candidatus Brocadia sp. WS118]
MFIDGPPLNLGKLNGSNSPLYIIERNPLDSLWCFTKRRALANEIIISYSFIVNKPNIFSNPQIDFNVPSALVFPQKSEHQLKLY